LTASESSTPGASETRYFTSIDGLMDGNADVILKETRQGKTVTAAVLTVLVALPAAYALARWNFRGQRVAYLLFVGTWLVPFQVTMVPNYEVVLRLGLLNTLAGVIIPRDAALRQALKSGLESFSGVFLLPLFFAFSGLRTQNRRRGNSRCQCNAAGGLQQAAAREVVTVRHQPWSP